MPTRTVAATSRDGGRYIGQIPSYSLGAKQMRCALAALNRLTQRVDGLGTTVYTSTMLGNGQQTVTENGPWASDEVTVTNRHGRRTGLRIGEPGGGGFRHAARLRLRRNDTRYDGLSLVQERDGGNVPLVTYTRGRDLSGTVAGAGGIGGLLARSHGYSGGNWTSHNFYHADGNGNVTALMNSAGTLQASYKYDPYGRYLSGGGSLASANGLRFSSKPWVGFAGSTTSGLYYFGYRFYDPYLQRWVNRDPIGEWGGFNLYNYTENRPGSVFDPMGLHNPIRTGRFWACMVDLGINTGISSIPIIGIVAPEVDFVQATIYGETDYELDPISTTLNLGEQSTCGKLNKRGKIVKPKRLMRWNRFFGLLGKLWEAKDILQNIRECWHKGKQPI